MLLVTATHLNFIRINTTCSYFFFVDLFSHLMLIWLYPRVLTLASHAYLAVSPAAVALVYRCWSWVTVHVRVRAGGAGGHVPRSLGVPVCARRTLWKNCRLKETSRSKKPSYLQQKFSCYLTILVKIVDRKYQIKVNLPLFLNDNAEVVSDFCKSQNIHMNHFSERLVPATVCMFVRNKSRLTSPHSRLQLPISPVP